MNRLLSVFVVFIALLIVGYFYVMNEENPDSSIDRDTTETESVTQQLPANTNEIAIPVRVPVDENQSPVSGVEREDDGDSEICETQFKEFEADILNQITLTTTAEERRPLYILTGWDWVLLQQISNGPVNEQVERFQQLKKNQLRLLKERNELDPSALYQQRYLQECVTNDIPEYCDADELEQIALENSDNLDIWLLLIHFYGNQSNGEKIAELINSAASATSVNNFESDYKRTIYNEIFNLTKSPAYSARFAQRFSNARLFGLETLQRYCGQDENLNCFQIGEALEQYGSSIQSRRIGLLIQSDYLQKTQQASALEIKAQELSQIQNKLDDIKANFKIPFDDQMADYLIEILDTQDEIEYYEKAIAEAERILEEKPELCTW